MNALNTAAHYRNSRVFAASKYGPERRRALSDTGAIRESELPRAMKKASASELVSGKVVLSMMVRPFVAFHRLLSGPPMTERERYSHVVATCRVNQRVPRLQACRAPTQQDVSLSARLIRFDKLRKENRGVANSSPG